MRVGTSLAGVGTRRPAAALQARVVPRRHVRGGALKRGCRPPTCNSRRRVRIGGARPAPRSAARRSGPRHRAAHEACSGTHRCSADRVRTSLHAAMAAKAPGASGSERAATPPGRGMIPRVHTLSRATTEAAGLAAEHDSGRARLDGAAAHGWFRQEAVRALVISPWSAPTLWSCPTARRCPCRTPRLVWPTGWRPHFRAPDRLERVAVGRLEVLERPQSSASADVLDGLGCWR
jgi:hypothetical protein